MTYSKEGLKIDINDLKNILTRLHKTGGMLMLHAEDDNLLEQKHPQNVKIRFKQADISRRQQTP